MQKYHNVLIVINTLIILGLLSSLIFATITIYKIKNKYIRLFNIINETNINTYKKIIENDNKIINELNNNIIKLIQENKKLKSSLLFYKNTLSNIIKYSKKHSKIYIIHRLSCYTPSKDETDNTPYKTAINKKIIIGKTAAVSRDLLFMLGKYIYIYGYGVFEVSDIMNRRFKNSIDLCLSDSKKYCKKFGHKQNVKVVILYNKH